MDCIVSAPADSILENALVVMSLIQWLALKLFGASRDTDYEQYDPHVRRLPYGR